MAPQLSSSSSSSTTTTTRWSPTAEQLMILEEMYRGGIKTPNASQIHHITTHLSSYGKIEGKNVFYWFQNHKARDRQKLRRKLMMHHLQHYNNNHKNQHHYYYNNSSYAHYQDTSKEWKKVGLQESCEIDNKTNISYDRDWMTTMTTMDAIPTPSCLNNKPLKTLQLFPTTIPTTPKDDIFPIEP